MKSFVSSIAALAIALFVVGCGESAPEAGDDANTVNTEEVMHDEAELAAEEGGEEAPAGEEEAPAGEEAPAEGEAAAE